jgi:hypothetical protein
LVIVVEITSWHNTGRRLLINDLINHGLHLTATVFASRDCCDTVWLPRCRLAWDLNTSSRLLLHFLNDTASSPNAQANILVWNLFTKQKVRSHPERGKQCRRKLKLHVP